MRLQAFINEGVKIGDTTYTVEQIAAFNKFWGEVEKNCKPYLSEIRKNGNKFLLVRGIKYPDEGAFIYKSVRIQRTPRDTPSDWHDAFGSAFKKMFGWNPRTEGMFCLSEKGRGAASGYGTVYFVFPDGNFKYVWSPSIDDLYSEVENFEWDLPDWYLESVKENYEREYGEGSDGGEWWWDGNTTSARRKEDAITEFIESWNDNIGEEDEHGEKMDADNPSDRRMVSRNMVWEPYVSWGEYESGSHESFEPTDEDYEKEAEKIIRNGRYSETGLTEAVNIEGKHHEISIKAKGYFGLMSGISYDKELGSVSYNDLIHYYVFKKKYIDHRQMELFDK